MYRVTDETIVQALAERDILRAARDAVSGIIDTINHSPDLSDVVDTHEGEDFLCDLAGALREYEDAIEGYAQSREAA